MNYYAHSDSQKNKKEWHLLKRHLEDTAQLASVFAGSFGAEKLGYLAGLLHDIGKYSKEFQRRLEGDKIRVDHSTAGAIESDKRYGVYGKILAYVIAGHHCGLPDWGSVADETSLESRLKKESLPDYSAYMNEINLMEPEELVFPIKKAPVGCGFSAQFFIRFLYSSLVDADFLDTERALDPGKSVQRINRASLAEMLSILDTFLDNKCRSAPVTPVNRHRAEILANCREKAVNSPGLFTLTVPTGGGKTLSSMAFALKHAVTHGMDRVIYVIPYTSIIEQNAAVFREIFGEEKVLEHHSNFDYPENDIRETDSENFTRLAEKLKLAAENWDMPIVATTNVQFFESLFAARSSRCRKLHNIANSVVIIDEAQMIPTGYLKPCINALVELITNYHTTVVLCTATQPAIKKFLPSEIKPLEIIDDSKKLYNAFQRVNVNYLGDLPLSDDLLAKKLLSHNQVLCIVNSKKHARLIFEKIQGEGVFHLSTRMCPAHRSETLKNIRERLTKGEICRVVSTQLIEAGVDVDFPVVYRSLAGIDSIAQSAGRCNREGLKEKGEVYVFRPEKHGLPAGWLSRTASVGGSIVMQHEDPLSLDAVRDYFLMLYDLEGEELDREMIMAEIKEQERMLKFPFRRIADKFILIDKNTTAVVIPWDEACRKLLQELRWRHFPGQYGRKLQKYTVDVYEEEFREMLRLGILENVADMFYVLREDVYRSYYNKEMGLLPCTESMFLNDTLIV
ncbi:CRISPR-associated helicase/endonuclease Cas3 [Thermincola potens]|uniref:Metal dependent phosphohydrolase n=1 Tax=Thermincola potens (strain JR) TaxID=635013 RepID=D5X819_THEPJ|nr:CRISPR-associated helicase/endonuclease Cas3 [Thermincola potens]ADG82739.1 metal dependent phosphohydrolase [Thermincola potens JR]